MKIDPRRFNMLPAPLPFEACGVRMTWNLVDGVPDGRVILESDGDPPRIVTQHAASKIINRCRDNHGADASAVAALNPETSLPFPSIMKDLRLTKARISKLQEAAMKVSGFIDTLKLTSDERTDLYAALLYAHVKNAQHSQIRFVQE